MDTKILREHFKLSKQFRLINGCQIFILIGFTGLGRIITLLNKQTIKERGVRRGCFY